MAPPETERSFEDLSAAGKHFVALAMLGTEFRTQIEARLLRNQPPHKLQQRVSSEVGQLCATDPQFKEFWNGLTRDQRRIQIRHWIEEALKDEAQRFPPDAPLETYLTAFQ